MTLQELIRRFRVMSQDKTTPYLWSDEDVTDWINDAQEEAAIRGRLIREESDEDVCKIELTAGTHTYTLNSSVIEISTLRLIPADGEPRTMLLKSREWLDAECPGWRDDDEVSCFAIHEDTKLRVVGGVNTGDYLLLECYRLPLSKMAIATATTDEPEIHHAHHEHLIEWALCKAFSLPDVDTFDAARSKAAEEEFTKYFGIRPDSDLRRKTREDVAHHNHAYIL